MADTKVAKKYATALFQLAREAGTEEAVWEDLAVLQSLLAEDERFLRVMASPRMSREEKKGLIRSLTGERAERVVQNFLLFLVDKGRTGSLVRMIEIYRGLLDEAVGVVEARITSAVPLSDSEKEQMVAKLERLSGKTLRHRFAIDAGMLGGVVVIMGGQIIDHSVRHDLARLRDALRALKVHEAA